MWQVREATCPAGSWGVRRRWTRCSPASTARSPAAVDCSSSVVSRASARAAWPTSWPRNRASAAPGSCGAAAGRWAVPRRTGRGSSRSARCLRDLDRAALRAHLGDGARHLARMVPEVRELLADVPSSPALDTDEARFQLFDATARFFKDVARTQPIVVILDDVHAADTPSLLLLRFLASPLHDGHLLVVATYRDGDHGAAHPLTPALAELSREPVTTRLLLRGLSQSDVARFIELSTTHRPPHGLITAVHAQTEGNPLFVGEVVQLLVREGRFEQAQPSAHGRLGIPPSVRQVIGQRLGHLSTECVRVLGLARSWAGSFPARARAAERDGWRPALANPR